MSRRIFHVTPDMDDGDIFDSESNELSAFLTDVELPSLLVLVEDADDINFWQHMFRTIENRYSSVDVLPLYMAAELNKAQRNAAGQILKGTGKDLLMTVAGLGKCKMLAVDADYDMIVDDYHNYTGRLRTDKYIVHTEYHSIENHLLDNAMFITRPEVSVLSACVEDYVYYILSEEMRIIAGRLHPNTPSRDLTVDELRGIIGSLQYDASTYSSDIPALFNGLVARGVDPNNHQYYSTIKGKCNNFHVSGGDVWKILQGHTFYEFIKKIFASEFKSLREEQEHNITSNKAIPGVEKPSMISQIKEDYLDGSPNVADKFREMVYSCAYLNDGSTSITKIRSSIVNAVVP